jgi:NhaP-type Na+/H+ or K+/H+ antiporter
MGVEHLSLLLDWEGSLIDPIGGVLGSVVFTAVAIRGGLGHDFGRFVLSILTGLGGAALGIAVLWLCLVKLEVEKQLATLAQLASVVASRPRATSSMTIRGFSQRS